MGGGGGWWWWSWWGPSGAAEESVSVHHVAVVGSLLLDPYVEAVICSQAEEGGDN